MYDTQLYFMEYTTNSLNVRIVILTILEYTYNVQFYYSS